MLLKLLVFALPAFGGFCVTFQPQDLRSSELALGTGKDFGLWRVIVTGADQPRISSEEIAVRFPHAFLAEWQARDVLDRKSARSGRGLVKSILGLVAQLAPAGLAAAGVATDTRWATWAGTGIAVVIPLASARQRPPDASQTIAHLLPDAGITGATDTSWAVVTGIVRGASKVGPVCHEQVAPVGARGVRTSLASPVEVRHIRNGSVPSAFEGATPSWEPEPSSYAAAYFYGAFMEEFASRRRGGN
jgi:hypothetical protein